MQIAMVLIAGLVFGETPVQPTGAPKSPETQKAEPVGSTADTPKPAASAGGQAEPGKERQPSSDGKTEPETIQKMKALDFLLGDWGGEGWMGSANQRNSFMITERVQSRLGGRVFLVEGLGTGKTDGAEPGPVIHEALGTISWDKAAGTYRMRAFKADGSFVDGTGEFAEGVFTWGFEVPSFGQIRHTVKLNEKGQWHEVGELRRGDSKEWTRFLEMTLSKK